MNTFTTTQDNNHFSHSKAINNLFSCTFITVFHISNSLIFSRLAELKTDEQVEQLIINGGNILSTSVTDEKIEQLARYFFEEVRRKKTVQHKPGQNRMGTGQLVHNKE